MSSPTQSDGTFTNQTSAEPMDETNPYVSIRDTHRQRTTLLERIRMSGRKEPEARRGAEPEASDDDHVARILFPDENKESHRNSNSMVSSKRATSGREALKKISFASTSIERVDMIGTDVILSAADVQITDTGIYLQFKSECHSPIDFILRWSSKDDNFKEHVGKFEKSVQNAAGKELRALMESMFELIVSSKQTSVELAVRCIIDLMTRGLRNQIEFTDFVRKENMRGMQVMHFNDAYIKSGHEHYEQVFRAACVTRDIPLDDESVRISSDLNSIPGYERLSHSDVSIRNDTWTWYFMDLMAYLCGPLQRNSISVTEERGKYFCPQNRDKTHPLRMSVDQEGNIMDIFDWFPLEAQAYQRLKNVSIILDVDLIPSENDRIGNAIRAMDPDFREEWNDVFRDSHLIPDDVVVPKGGFPVIPFEIMKKLMIATQTRIRKDLSGKKATRAARIKKESEERKKRNENKGTFKSGGKCRHCRGDHATSSCSQATEICDHFAKFGTCKFGEDCKGKHVSAKKSTGDSKTKGTESKNTDQKQTVKKSCDGEKSIEKECRRQSVSSGCTKKFTLDMEYWDKKVKEDGWVLPEDCENCRKEKREQRAAKVEEGSLFTGFESEIDDERYEEADDDYFCGHSMAMSDAMLLAADPDMELAEDQPQHVHQAHLFENTPVMIHDFEECELEILAANIEANNKELAEMGIDVAMMVAEEDTDSTDMDSPLPADHARWEVRQRVRDGMKVPKLLKEAADLEAQLSSCKPAKTDRTGCPPNKYSESGFVMLGDQVDTQLMEKAYDEAEAALLHESFEHSQNSADSAALALDNDDEFQENPLFIPIPAGSEDFWYPSSNADDVTKCTCEWDAQFPGMCESCQQCLDCCSCPILELEQVECAKPQDEICGMCYQCFDVCTCDHLHKPGDIGDFEDNYCPWAEATLSFEGQCTRCMLCPGCCSCTVDMENIRKKGCHCADPRLSDFRCYKCMLCVQCCDCENLNETALPASVVHCATSMEFLASTGFLGVGNNRWTAVPMCFDTLSMSALFNSEHLPNPLPTGWKWESTGGSVIGAGDLSTPSRGKLVIPEFKYSNSGRVHSITCSVIKLPKGVTLVIGAVNMMSEKVGVAADIVPDLANYRVYIVSANETVRLDWLPRVIKRLKAGPVNILSFFGGLEPAIDVMKNLGFRIGIYKSVEIDEYVRKIMTAKYSELSYVEANDVRDVTCEMYPDVDWYAVTGGPPCQKSSRRNDNPQFDTELFEEMRRVLDDIGERCGSETLPMNKIFENVIPHRKIESVREEWNAILGMQSQRHNAVHSGSLASRDRLYWTNVNLGDLTIVTHRCPEVCFEKGWLPVERPVPHLMARGDHTERKVWVQQYGTGKRRLATPNERDTINPGLPPGCSGDGERDVRNIGNGNAFSADVLWHIMREWEIPHHEETTSLMTADDVYAAHPDALELFFTNMDTSAFGGDRRAAILGYFREFAKKYGKVHEDTGNLVMPVLDLVVNQCETVNYQVPHECDVPAHLAASAEYCMEMMCRDGSHEKVDWKPHFWIIMLFFQPKGRKTVAEFDGELFKKGDELEALRPLKDMRAINAATAECVPVHWADWSPDRMLVCREIPEGTKSFKPYDASNAYHSVETSERLSDMCVSKARILRKTVKLLRALKGSQGLSAMGTYFPIWSAHGNSFFVGTAWTQWWLEHIDDVLAHAPEDSRCQLRWEVMSCVKQMMGLVSSEKMVEIPPTFRAEHVGFLWTPQGHCIGDKSITFLQKVLTTRPRGGVEAMRLRGSINQSMSAFDWNSEETNYSLVLLAPLNDCIARWQSEKKFCWDATVEEAIQELVNRLTNQPRQYSHPDWVCSDKRSLCGQGDWSKEGISWHLFSVDVPDASEITAEMLHDPSRVRLLTMHPHAFNSNQRKWHCFEGEGFAQIHGAIRKCGKYINTCLAPFFDSPHPKYAWGTDSMVTIWRLPKLTLPELKMNHLSSKVQRFIGWSEEAAMTRFWPQCRLHTPDSLNNLADACCRIVAQLQTMYPGIVTQDAEDVDRCEHQDMLDEITAMPLAVHTYASERDDAPTSMLRVVGMPTHTPKGTNAYTMLMSLNSWRAVEEAYLQDCQEYCGVRLSEIYMAIATTQFDGNSITAHRIKQWNNRLFYPMHIAADKESDGEDIRVLYTPSRITSNISPDGSTYPDLVLVVPDKTCARISGVKLEDFPWEPEESNHDWAKWYLREDIIWVAHNAVTPHAGLHATIEKVKEQAYWRGMEEQIKRHVDECAICLSLYVPRIAVNMGIHSNARFWVMQFDDHILSNTVKQATGFHSVLGMTELSTGIAIFACRRTKLAREACLIVWSRYVPIMSTPRIISSDLDPALTGAVASFLCSMLGVEDRVNVTQGLKCPQAEARNKYLARAIACAEAKGDLTSPEALILTVGAAQIYCNQMVVTDDATCFERMTGAEPITAQALVSANRMSPEQITTELANANPEDAEFMSRIRDRCDELIKWHDIKADQRARYNLANNLAKQSNQLRSDFGFEEGQQVAVGDKIYTIVDIPKVANNIPAVVEVIDQQGKTLKMLASKLRPLAVHRPEILSSQVLPRDGGDFKVGDLVFYQESESNTDLLAGVILSAVEEDFTVQIHQPKAGVGTWLPRWEDPAHTHKIIRAKACPIGCNPFTDDINASQIITTGKFTGKGYTLDDPTIYQLRILGYEPKAKPAVDTGEDATLCMAFDDHEYADSELHWQPERDGCLLKS